MIRNDIEIQTKIVKEKNDRFNISSHSKKDFVVLNGKKDIDINKLDSYRDSQFVKVFLLTALLLLLSVLKIFIVFFLNKNLFQDDHRKMLFDHIKYFALVALSVGSAYLICRILMLCCNMNLEDAAIARQLEKRNEFINLGDYNKNGSKKSIGDALLNTNCDDIKKDNVSSNIMNDNIRYEIQSFDVSYNDFISEYTKSAKNINFLWQESDNLYAQFLNILNKECIKDHLSLENTNPLESWHAELTIKLTNEENYINQSEEKISQNYTIALNLYAALRPILHEYTQYTSIFEFLSVELFGMKNEK